LSKPDKSEAKDESAGSENGKTLSLKQRLQDLVREYGRVAIVVYFSLWILTVAGFYLALRAGIHVGSGSGKAGTLVAAWLATKLTLPLRIGATLVLTPLLSRAKRSWEPQLDNKPASKEEA